jgi:hypothetical protein
MAGSGLGCSFPTDGAGGRFITPAGGGGLKVNQKAGLGNPKPKPAF